MRTFFEYINIRNALLFTFLIASNFIFAGIEAESTPTSDFEASDGSIDLTITDGESPYEVYWTGPDNPQNPYLPMDELRFTVLNNSSYFNNIKIE